MPDSVPRLDQLGWFALLVLVAVVLGELARFVKMPRILGYVAAGIALGPYGTGLMHWATTYDLRVLVDVALGLLLFELGHALDMTWLRRNPWLLATSVLEAGLTFAAVYGALRLAGVSNIYCAGAAAIGMSTSPAIVVQLTRELRAQGQVTERLRVLTALNSAYAVIAVSVWISWLHLEYEQSPAVAVLHPIYLMAGALLIAVVAALVARLIPRNFRSHRSSILLIVLGLILIVIAGAKAFVLSPLLSLLLFGSMARRWVPWLRVLPPDLATISSMTAVILFALIGASLNPSIVSRAAIPATAFILARLVAKCAASFATAVPAGITLRKGSMLGLGLAPMSGLAIVMVQDVTGIYPALPSDLSLTILSAVVVLEIVGPILTSVALGGAKESHRD